MEPSQSRRAAPAPRSSPLFPAWWQRLRSAVVLLFVTVVMGAVTAALVGGVVLLVTIALESAVD